MARFPGLSRGPSVARAARRNRRRRTRLLMVAALVALVVTTLHAPAPAKALSNGSGTIETKGFDTCQDPTEGQMQAFWNGTPYWWLGTYIGGSEMGCSQPNLNATWLNDVRNQGWNFEFIWVGPQSPCTSYRYTFSSNPSTAYTQGQNEASSAWTTLTNLGITNGALHTAIVYDLESSPSGCQSATNSFIQGWINELHISPAQVAGVYGSVCGSSLQSYASLNPPPDFIWGAYYDGNSSTSDLWAGSCGVPSGDWVYHQRLKQYNNTHYETWNGVTLSVDDDCANGPVDPSGNGAVDNSCL